MAERRHLQRGDGDAVVQLAVTSNLVRHPRGVLWLVARTIVLWGVLRQVRFFRAPGWAFLSHVRSFCQFIASAIARLRLSLSDSPRRIAGLRLFPRKASRMSASRVMLPPI